MPAVVELTPLTSGWRSAPPAGEQTGIARQDQRRVRPRYYLAGAANVDRFQAALDASFRLRLRAGQTRVPCTLEVLAIFGPTGVGKTAVAVAVADLLRAGEEVVAVSCDAIQVYRGLETLAGDGDPAGALAARAPAGRLRRGERRVQRRPVRDPCARGDRPAPRGGTAADRGRWDRSLPARRARRPRAPTAGSAGRTPARSRPRSPPEARRRFTVSSTRTSPRRSTPRTASGSLGRSSSSARASIRREGASSCGPQGFVARPFSSA